METGLRVVSGNGTGILQPHYVIRPATLVDQPELKRMAQHFVEQTGYGRLLAYDERAVGSLIVTVLERGIVLLAEHVRPDVPEPIVEAVGMLAMIAFPHPVAGFPYADEICWWVERSHRKGLGRNLLGAAEIWARQNGCHLLKMVAPAGTSAGRFYETQGFEALETAYVKRLT